MVRLEGFHTSSSKHLPDIQMVIRTRLLTFTADLQQYMLPHHHRAAPPLLALNPIKSVQLH